jgi:uncharacterized protein YfiM (DUF2279 family)
VHTKRQADFDLGALYAALDAQREARGLSWEATAREINRSFEGVTTARPLSASTMTGIRRRSVVEGNCVLLMLEWLGRTPESFIPNHPAPTTAETALPSTDNNRILRWNPPALHAALDARRQARGMTWRQVAADIGGVTPAMLTGLAVARHVGFPRVMRLVTWVEQPAARFTAPRSR